MALEDGAIAAIRFGLGARPGEIESRAVDPRASLLQELQGPDQQETLFARRPGSEKLIARFMRERERGGDRAVIRLIRKDFRQVYSDEARLRTAAAVTSPTPFAERLVHFWSNHFTVSAKRPILAGLAGAYEREAIRPHINGRFSDMLQAVVHHPAMILYLDNVLSIGPNSAIGQRAEKGMNENLAREILELHTLGVDGGYDQADVITLAKMLTGWSIARPNNAARPGRFRFYGRAHEPGTRTLLGRLYAEEGVKQAEKALDDIARHPSTIRHLSTKLVRHFTSDRPDEADMRHLVDVWQKSDGDLQSVSSALLDLPSAWRPLTKLKTPNELLVSSLRATGHTKVRPWAVGALSLLGQAPWSAPSPQGWADNAQSWLGAAQVMNRIEFASAWLERSLLRQTPLELAETSLGPLLDDDIRQAIDNAESRDQAFTVAMTSPAFQRR
jgi:uncharacterized protein (DUF1800 family)